jgi:hypothetical protein
MTSMTLAADAWRERLRIGIAEGLTMTFHLYPPAGVVVDLAKGIDAAQRVFAAHRTLPEIAVFGHEAADKVAQRRRIDPLSQEEQRLADVFRLAASSAFEACTGSPNPPGWKCGVKAPDDVYLWAPGVSLEAHRRGVEGACAVFRAAGISPQAAAMGDWEQQAREIRGHKGPDLSAEACRGAEVFYDAQHAAREASGNIPGSYMRVEGCDEPEWQQYAARSQVLNWKPEDEIAIP